VLLPHGSIDPWLSFLLSILKKSNLFVHVNKHFYLRKNAHLLNFVKKTDCYTTLPQHRHNTPSHGGGAHTLSLTPCEGCCAHIVLVL